MIGSCGWLIEKLFVKLAPIISEKNH